VVNSRSSQTLRVDSVEHPITVDQTITYTECAHEAPPVDSVRIAVSRNFFTYSGDENIVRYSQTNRVPGTGTRSAAYTPFTRSSKHQAIRAHVVHVYFEYICLMVA